MSSYISETAKCEYMKTWAPAPKMVNVRKILRRPLDQQTSIVILVFGKSKNCTSTYKVYSTPQTEDLSGLAISLEMATKIALKGKMD